MHVFKKIILALLFFWLAIQVISPTRNRNKHLLASDITSTLPVPDSVLSLLSVACYDCHSNNTRYPWYAKVQPVAWMMANHVKEGKADLNFSEFGTYSKRKQANKLRSLSESLQEGSMPLSSYTLIHKDAKLLETQRKIIITWAQKAQDSLAAR